MFFSWDRSCRRGHNKRSSSESTLHSYKCKAENNNNNNNIILSSPFYRSIFILKMWCKRMVNAIYSTHLSPASSFEYNIMLCTGVSEFVMHFDLPKCVSRLSSFRCIISLYLLRIIILYTMLEFKIFMQIRSSSFVIIILRF